ncbi:hypothetical protein EVJ50_03350 [Synechococcus sp. RSCCF101]|uniref:hypothetical protein n=1 Tax=Synechococcus sp. RSCCF101 TaxID=2511069 RepID=UPI001243EF68|nr:hypothetical protein [Synechococcus sp. RSCCF101]QEY31430.1 hypothetical protein EVJ50_03350 [Synechococcus sp. RSCCF101]
MPVTPAATAAPPERLAGAGFSGLTLLHALPGRLRWRYDLPLSGDGQELDAARLRRRLLEQPGIHEVTLSPAIHSLGIRFDPAALDRERLERLLLEEPLPLRPRLAAPRATAATAPRRWGG